MMLSVRLLEVLGVRKRREDLPVMRALVSPSGDGDLLDIGGGGGTATRTFARDSRSITVLEPDIRKTRFGSRRHPDIRFVRGRAEALPFVHGAFARVTAVVSLHHAESLDRAIAEARRVLESRGRLVVHELYPGPEPRGIARILARRFHGSPPMFMEPRDLRHLLEMQGFEVEVQRDGVRGYFVAAKVRDESAARAGSEI